jgi:hypothetical protein
MGHEALLETLLKGYEEGALREFFANLTNYISADGEDSWGVLRDPDRGETPILVRSVADSERHRVAFKELGEFLAKNHASAGVALLHDKEGRACLTKVGIRGVYSRSDGQARLPS